MRLVKMLPAFRITCLKCILACFLIFFNGCANGYRQFYTPVPQTELQKIQTLRSAHPVAPPLIERGSFPVDQGSLLKHYFKKGYIAIGRSFFHHTEPQHDDSAVRQGIAVGADLVVIFDPQFSHTTTGALPLMTPTASTSYTTASATAYGLGTPITAYGSGTTTTYGSSTSFIPFSVQHTNYGAVFFVKLKNPAFGASFRDLTDAEKSRMQTNKGAAILGLRNDSPAFRSDFLEGDIIKKVDSIEVLNGNHISEIIKERYGKKVTVLLIRGGRALEKTVQLDNPN
jgi:hypothetical protein